MKIDVNDVLGSPLIALPFSVAVNGFSNQRSRDVECVICKGCEKRTCHSLRGYGVKICHQEVRFHLYEIQGDQLVVYGLAPHEAIPKRRIEAFKGRRFPDHVINDWVSNLRDLLHMIEAGIASAQNEALEAIHDVSRLATEVSSLSSQIVGDDLDAAPSSQLALVKSSELLVKEFERIELLINPASAAAGRIYAQIYKLCHKYAKIIDLAFAKPNNKRVRMSGRSHREIRVYESINVLVFSLIGNATKYGMSGEDVVVEVNDVAIGNSIQISVTSVGPLIEGGEIDHIFEKGFRGRWAKEFTHDGRGVGLYLAKIVADAHNTFIHVTSSSLGYERNGIPCASNVFKVRLDQI